MKTDCQFFYLFFNVIHTLLDNGADMGVGKRIENGFALPAAFYQLALFENLQLMRNGRLGHAEGGGQVADANLCFEKDKQDTNAGGVAENFKQFREIIQVRFRRHVLVYGF